MSSGTSIIEDALKRIKVVSVAVPSSPEQITDGLAILNSLIQTWYSKGIKMGAVPIETAGSDLNEPIDARSAIVDNLALMMAPLYDGGTGKAIVSEDLKRNARLGFADLKTQYQDFSIPQKVASSTLPKGAGNYRGFRTRVFNPKGGELGG